MTASTTTSLADFLLAQLADDEAVALAAVTQEGTSVYAKPGVHGERMLAHVTRHDPTRVLANVAALRAVIELHVVGDPDEWSPEQWACRLCQWDEDCDSPKHDHQHGAGRFPCDTLRALAQPFADRPGFREEWAS